MKKNIKIILLLFLFLAIPKNTKALEENQVKLFEDFTYNETKIKGFIYKTDMQYLKTYFQNDTTNYYYNWTPKNEIIPNYTIIDNTYSGNIELHIQMLNYQFYDYGWKYVNYNTKLILQKIQWVDSNGYTRNYRWTQRQEDGTYINNTTTYSNMYYLPIVFKYNKDTMEWEQITNYYENRTTHGTNFLRDSQSHYQLVIENKSNSIATIIQTNIEILDSNYNRVEFEEYKETIIKEEYQIEDSTEEKETINENDLIINEDITNLIKNNFLQISKNENLYKIIITIFITSLIIIIKNKV